MGPCAVNAGHGKARPMKRGHRSGTPKGGYPHFYGRHAIIAALANPDRVIRKIWGTREAIAALDLPPGLPIIYSDAADLAPPGAARRAAPGHRRRSRGARGHLARRPARARPAGRGGAASILVLDQVTDPHNVGAILRSAAAFDALGHRDAGPACPARIRRGRPGRGRRARIRALGARGQSRPRAR